jgi:hypothetical protein
MVRGLHRRLIAKYLTTSNRGDDVPSLGDRGTLDRQASEGGGNDRPVEDF